jgi:bifunctional DNase/RNase
MMRDEMTCSRDGCNMCASACTLIVSIDDSASDHVFACRNHFVDPFSEYAIRSLSQLDSDRLGMAYEACVLKSVSFENDPPRYTVVLQSTQSRSALLLLTGYMEATWIRLIATKFPYPGPSTHALLLGIINSLDGELKEAVVDGYDKNTGQYVCHLRISKGVGEPVNVECGASEAVAICLACGLSVTVDKALLCSAENGKCKGK